jgi:hypothetical protein
VMELSIEESHGKHFAILTEKLSRWWNKAIVKVIILLLMAAFAT